MPRKDRTEYLKEYYQRNKDKIATRQRQYKQDNTERLKQRDATYRDANREHINQRNKEYKQTHKEQTQQQNTIYRENNREQLQHQSLKYYANNKEQIKQRKLKQKAEIYSHYGPLQCPCGETRLGALTIDHINQNGAQHKKEISNKNLHRWLKKNNYPEGYRILCINCNILAYIEHRTTIQSNNRKAKRHRKERAKTKVIFMSLLGSKCTICHKDDNRILTVHHINNDGKQHRDKISNGKGGYRFYKAILKSPNIEQELKQLECRCFSCNCNEQWQ